MTQTVGKTDIATEHKSVAVPPWVLTAGCVAIFAAASAYVFRGVWNTLNTIDGTDASLWVPMFVQQWTKWLFVPRWFPHFLAGIGQQFQFLSHGLILMLTLPPYRFHGFEFMLDTFLAGVFMFAFLRSQRLGRFGSLIGGLSYELSNGLLTAARQGALWKFDTVCWAPLFFLFFTRILEDDTRRLRNCLFAGATLGLQFLGGEIQLAYYVCLLAFAYFATDSVEKLWTAGKAQALSTQLKTTGKRLLWAGLAAVIGIAFAAEVFCSYLSYTRSNVNVGVRTAADNWRFATEFSFPPRETLSLALTDGIFIDDLSFRDYEGHPINRITDDYMGIVVIMFAFVALFSDKRRRYFFTCAAFVTLLISFGRYFPLPYRLVYALPMMQGFRNPHKWLFVTSLCVSIVAGMGADYWKNAPSIENRRIIAAVIAFLVIVFAAAISGAMAVPARLPVEILIIASLACIIAWEQKVNKSRVSQVAPPLVLVILLAFDLTFNASKFILYYNYHEKYAKNPLAKWLTSKAQPFRVKLWSESPHLRYVMTQVLPYYGIDVMDAIMSRRPARYSEVFEATREGRLSYEKLFALFNVRYVLSSTAIQRTDIPMNLAIILESNAGRTPPDDCYIYEFRNFLPRVYMANRFEVVEPDKVIDTLGRRDFDALHCVVLEQRPSLVAGDEPDPNWSVKDFQESPHRVSMNVLTDKAAILVLQDFFDENWHALVDDREVEILRANYLMRGIVVPGGTHDVVFVYEPAVWGFILTLAGWVVLGSVCIIEGVRWFLRANNRGIVRIYET